MPNKTEKVDPLHSGILLLAGNSVCGSSSLQPYLHKSYYLAKLTIIKKLAHHDHSTPQSDRNIDRVNAEFIIHDLVKNIFSSIRQAGVVMTINIDTLDSDPTHQSYTTLQ